MQKNVHKSFSGFLFVYYSFLKFILIMIVFYLEFSLNRLTRLSTLSKTRGTHGDKMIHTLLVKYFNDLFDGQKSEQSIDKVTYFYVGDLFCIHLGSKYPNFQEKIFAEISGKNA